MKKYFLPFILSSFLLLTACSKATSDNQLPMPKKEEGQPSPSKEQPSSKETFLTGTFLQLFGKDDWSPSQWEQYLLELKELRIHTLIVQYTAFKNAYNDITWFDSANTFTTQKSRLTLARVLEAAQRQGVEVHIGLHFDDSYWQHQTDRAWLELNAQRCIALAKELHTQFGNHPAFKGWYIPHEPEPYAYGSDEKIALFREVLVNPIADSIHQWDRKPISIAAFWNSALTSPNQLQHFMAELAKSHLQIIMLQDGVGAKHVTLDQLGTYYQSAQKGLFEENKNYKGAFWTDLETFYSPTGEYPFTPASFDRVKQQLTIETALPKVSKAVSFQYYDDMSTLSPHKAQAQALREAYKKWLNQNTNAFTKQADRYSPKKGS